MGVYKDTPYVKIGQTGNLSKRQTEFQTIHLHSLETLLVLDGNCEKEMHKLFKKEHIHNELFVYSNTLHEFIKNIKRNTPSPFYMWLNQQIDRDDHIADFAREVCDDVNFPRSEVSFLVIEDYLWKTPVYCQREEFSWERSEYRAEAKEAFELAYREYMMGREDNKPVWTNMGWTYFPELNEEDCLRAEELGFEVERNEEEGGRIIAGDGPDTVNRIRKIVYEI